ncbi:MAG: Gldg family protein [Opitutales bacterium]|nr:Gldg family protein [Opitutales bacterium]
MKFDDFRVTTKIRKINLWIQILLGFTLYVGLNFLSARHYYSYDFSESHKNSLSPESKAYIKNLVSPIDIYVVVSTQNLEKENMSVLKDLELFLSRYEASSTLPNKIRVKFVNSNMESKTADELTKKFGKNIENSIIVSGKVRSKIIPIDSFMR